MMSTKEVHKFVDQKYICYSPAATCFGLVHLQGHHCTLVLIFLNKVDRAETCGRCRVIL
jgi:hypothetical protein